MLCSEFEDCLTDYLEGGLDGETHRLVAAHALRCPVCHQTLAEVKNTVQACRLGAVPAPSRNLETRILRSTMPETEMSCENFEEFLTDYLDGFLPAPLYHRWERHAALCDRCTELPGDVVRSIGACYVYIREEKPLPAGLNERILQATLGTVTPAEIRASLSARVASWLRGWLDPIVSPQLATVATMLLMAVFVLTNTVSADGSISGVYQASMRLAKQSNVGGNANVGIKEFTDGLKELVGSESKDSQSVPTQKPGGTEKQPTKQNSNSGGDEPNKR